jgi:hypothetical protein
VDGIYEFGVFVEEDAGWKVHGMEIILLSSVYFGNLE